MNARQFLFYKLQTVIGSRVESCYAELKRFERSSVADLTKFQEQSLAQLLNHAAANVSFYQSRVSGVRTLSLSQFPILTKSDITRNFEDLMTKQLSKEFHGTARRSFYSWIPVQTGGSTGIPTTVIHDSSYRDKGRAARAYAQELCGFPVGTPYFRLWGSMRDINQIRNSTPQRILSWLQAEIILNAFRMGDKEMARYVDIINASSANHMMCYVDAACQLALFVKRKKLSVRPLESIMVCAGTVTDDAREVLHEVFRAKVHNQYGSRDCGGIACECEAGTIHTYGTNVIVEAVDDQGRPAGAGKTGRLLITLLGNLSFPIIRYEIGDMGAIASTKCACGRVFPCLAKIEGRKLEFLISTDGSYVTPIYVRHLIGVVHNPGLIQKFQLIQRTATDFQLRIVTDCAVHMPQFQTLVANVKRDLKAVLGEKANINIVREDDLELTASDKFLYTMNLTNTQPS